MNSTSSKMYNLYDFADAHSEIDPIINSYFTNILNSPTSINNRTYLDENLRYDMTYSPYAHLGNQENYDINLPDIFASCTQMNPDINEEMEDYIPCWKLENGELKYMYINEEDLSVIRNPIIIIDNNTRESEVIVYHKEQLYTFDLDDEGTPPTSGQSNFIAQNIFDMSGFRVEKAYKYEKGISGKIDFAIVGSLSRSSGGYGDADDLVRTCKVKKNKLSTNITKYLEIFNPSHPSFPTNNGCYQKSILTTPCYTGLATFERDPLASAKLLANVCHSLPLGGAGTALTLSGHRNYYGDWYSWDPVANTGYDINILHSVLNVSQNWTNYKGYFTVYNPS